MPTKLATATFVMRLQVDEPVRSAVMSHSPGSVCLYCPDLGTVFTGDTLFAGGPGATGRSFSDFGTITASIRDRLLTLPSSTRVRPGHGPSTTIGEVVPHFDEWVARGY
ncbi:hypothetical protein GCM10027174_46150 [Salinifilum aidingensis]